MLLYICKYSSHNFRFSFIFAEFSHDVVSTKMVTPPEVNFRLVNKHKNHSSKCLIDMMIQVEPFINATGCNVVKNDS